MKKHIWSIGYGIALTAFTLYITLDTFVLSSTYQENTTKMNTSMFENITSEESVSGGAVSGPSDTARSDGEPEHRQKRSSEDFSGNGRRGGKGFGPHNSNSDSSNSDNSNSDNSNSDNSGSSLSNGTSKEIDTYKNDYSEIKLTEYYENNTRIYVADVTVTSAQYIKTAFANDTYGKNVTANTSQIAESNKAVLAINGDYYGAQETGYVIRNGVLYRDTAGSNDVMCLYADGSIQVYEPTEYSADQLVKQGVWQAFSFGPGLVSEKNITVLENDEVGKAMASNPRTAFGMIDKNHYMFVVSDGRTSESEGLSLYQLAVFMKKLGAVTAYNLDGGGSSTMYYDGKVINNPTTTGGTVKERGVSDIVYVG